VCPLLFAAVADTCLCCGLWPQLPVASSRLCAACYIRLRTIFARTPLPSHAPRSALYLLRYTTARHILLRASAENGGEHKGVWRAKENVDIIGRRRGKNGGTSAAQNERITSWRADGRTSVA